MERQRAISRYHLQLIDAAASLRPSKLSSIRLDDSFPQPSAGYFGRVEKNRGGWSDRFRGYENRRSDWCFGV